MDLSQKLTLQRQQSALSQQQVAQMLGVPRELISLWETGKRVPGLAYLEPLAAIFGVNAGYLLGSEELRPDDHTQVYFRGQGQASVQYRAWRNFLDRWSQFLSLIQSSSLPGPRRPPREIDQGYLTDARRAAKLALEVRQHYALGEDALPDLWAFLDRMGVIVYQAPLGDLAEGAISGAFVNHPQLGWSILVNSDTSRGRQVFTLAHELAHALYHYKQPSLISFPNPQQQEHRAREKFANHWAAHFLVPGSALRSQLGRLNASVCQPSEFEVLQLAHYFRVSYSTLVYRLLGEGLIDEASKNQLLQSSAEEIAARLGLQLDDYGIPTGTQDGFEMARYPIGVLQMVRHALETGLCSLGQASSVLDLDRATLQDWLQPLPIDTTGQSKKQFEELVR